MQSDAGFMEMVALINSQQITGEDCEANGAILVANRRAPRDPTKAPSKGPLFFSSFSLSFVSSFRSSLLILLPLSPCISLHPFPGDFCSCSSACCIFCFWRCCFDVLTPFFLEAGRGGTRRSSISSRVSPISMHLGHYYRTTID